jgi:hypothetical protein
VASALLGNPVVDLAHGVDPGRLNQLGLLDRRGRMEQLGMRQVHFTGGSATVGSIAAVTSHCLRTMTVPAHRREQLPFCMFTPSDTNRRAEHSKPATDSR